MKAESKQTERELVTLKKEQAYIRELLGVEADEGDSSTELAAPIQEDYTSSCDELEEDSDKCKPRSSERTTSTMSSDGGYMSSSDEEKSQDKKNKSVSFIVELDASNSCIVNEIAETHNHKNLPLDLQKLLEGLNYGLPPDYSVPIDNKPEWLDMEKFKLGQNFAQTYYFGLNYSEMLALMILFSFPGGLQPLIYTGNSGTPFTAFRRYLSTALRVKSWFEHDVWTEGSLGYRNIKTVRAMHLNVSKRLNSTPHDERKNQLSLCGSSNDAAVWCTLKQDIQQDFQSCCPFQAHIPVDDHRPNKVFVNQLDMSITQFGFIGLMVMYPNKFGAGSATQEELDGFVHLWRGLGYLLGIEDKYNFCNGTFEEVRQRCHYLVDEWAKPSFQQVTEDWEHMSRCMVEGISYYVPGLSFEVSLFYLCWVMGVPAPRLYASLSWWQHCMFYIVKMTMTFTFKLPGMITFHNWLICRALDRASSMSPDKMKKLEAKTYDYEKKCNFNTRL